GTMVTCGSKVYANQTSDSWFTDNAGRAAELRTLQRMMIFMALLFLVFRPQGLFGEKIIERV
ncbi:MAG: hypothetical protein VX228_15590, partial [Pseudomonadota bacterium]|nr:hypothetical protein [Pseudomonadota bacterium]